MYILASILQNDHHWDKKKISVFLKVFCVVFGAENLDLDTKIFFLNQLETEILNQLYSSGHFGKKWLPRY